MRRAHTWRAASLAAVVALGLVVLAGCGSSSSSSSSSSSGAASSSSASASAVPAATQAYYVANVKTPTSVGIIGGPLTKKPPTGLRIDFLACPLPTCESQATYFAAAVKHFGWTVKTVVFQASAQGIQDAFNTAIADKPAGVVTSGFLEAAFAQQLAKLKAMGIPVVDYFSGNPPGHGIITAVGNVAILKFADNMAAWATVQGDNKANVIEFNVPSYGVQAIMHTRLQQDFTGRMCTGCHYTYVPLSLTDIGPGLPAKVVAAVQRTTGPVYLVFGFSELTTGVPAALAAAGLTNRVKIITAGAEQPTFAAIRNGQITAATAQPLQEQQWCLADQLARKYAGDPVSPVACNLPSQILTKQNVTAVWPAWPGVPNWQAAFLKSWGVS